MKKQILSLSVASAIALAAGAPATYAIDMQSRTALANCMVEAAISIAATMTTHKGTCEQGEWSIGVVVDEWIGAKIPIQGSVKVIGAETDYELNGKMAAVFNPLLDDVNCRVDTVDKDSIFAGVPFKYSGGDDTLYPDALTDKNDPLLDVSTFFSEGNVTINERPRVRLNEDDELNWANGPDDTFMATGEIDVLVRRGKKDQVLSEWETADEGEVYGWIEYIPDLDPYSDEVLEGGMKVEFVSDDLGADECKIIFEGDAAISAFWLTINGTIKVD